MDIFTILPVFVIISARLRNLLRKLKKLLGKLSIRYNLLSERFVSIYEDQSTLLLYEKVFTDKNKTRPIHSSLRSESKKT